MLVKNHSKLKATSRITLSLYFVVIAIGIYSTGTALKSYLATINLKSYAQPKFEELKISTGKISFDSTDSTSSNTIITTSDGSRILLGCYGPYTRHDCYITEESGYKFSMQKQLVGETAIAWWYPIENKPYGRLYQMEVRGRTLFTYDKKVNDYNRGFLRGNRKKMYEVLLPLMVLVFFPVVFLRGVLNKNYIRQHKKAEPTCEKLSDASNNFSDSDSQQDICLFEASYSKPKTWFSLIIMSIPGSFITAFSLNQIKSGVDLSIIIFCFASFFFWFLVFDSLLLEKICFYKNRVVKKWCFGKSVTIFYSNGVFTAPPAYLKWLISLNIIMKTDNWGQSIVTQLPISFISLFFCSREWVIISNILDYLTDSNRNYPSHFTKQTLEKETICQQG